MKQPRLTDRALAATQPRMRMKRDAKRSNGRALGAAIAVLGSGMTVSGCISVSAPDKPIVIELNINIKQEVVYRLAADAGNTIDNNRDIF